MDTLKSRAESFDESVTTIAERVRADRDTSGPKRSSEELRALEREKIRTELQDSYGSDAHDEDDGTEHLTPASLDASSHTDPKSYLEQVDEEYKETVAELVQSALTHGISRAVAKAQKKNDPYVVDVFHDSLAHLLHQRMQDQGLL